MVDTQKAGTLSAILLGIDQGSSHTWAVAACTDGELLALGKAPGACHALTGMDRAMGAFRDASQEAMVQAGLSKVDFIFGGLTGADWDDEFPLLEHHIRRIGICERVRVENDAIIALRGGTERKYGVILIAGSGGNCAVRAPDGRQFIYGYFWDGALQGGGALARRVLESVYRSYTGQGPETSLTGSVLQHFGLSNVVELMRADVEKHLSSAKLLDLALILFEEDLCGDGIAGRIIDSFATGYAEAAVVWLRRFGMTDLEMDVVLSGSIFKARTPRLVETVAAGILAAAPQARLVNAHYEPVVGAVLLGLEEMGIEVTAQIRANIEASAGRLGLIRPKGGTAHL
jgi:N-acetylglucosamine kinase-like BadF-type ATPase